MEVDRGSGTFRPAFGVPRGTIRVANVIEEGKLGGPQVRMVRVAAVMDGADTLIVMPRANSERFQALCEETEVRCRVLPLTRITREWRAALGYVLFSPLEVVRLARLLRRERIDLVHASGGSWQYKAVIAAWLSGIPSVWHLNDTGMPGWVTGIFRGLVPLAKGIIFTSVRARGYYEPLIRSSCPSAIVPPPVDISHFNPNLAFDTDREVIEEWRDDLVVGTLANVNPIKGIETLIKAIAHLTSREVRVRFVVVGPIYANQQAYADRLQKLAAAMGVPVAFVGGRGDPRPLLQRMDIYVCSSVSESWGLSLFEAMAMGRPVVTTDVGDVRLHIRDGETGFVVPVGDDQQLADRISKLAADAILRERMGRAARGSVDAFAPARIAEQTLALYRRVLAAEAGGPAIEEREPW